MNPDVAQYIANKLMFTAGTGEETEIDWSKHFRRTYECRLAVLRVRHQLKLTEAVDVKVRDHVHVMIVPIFKTVEQTPLEKTFVTQRIETFSRPTAKTLAAYRVLLDESVIAAVFINNYTVEDFERDFPHVKSFLTTDSQKGIILA